MHAILVNVQYSFIIVNYILSDHCSDGFMSHSLAKIRKPHKAMYSMSPRAKKFVKLARSLDAEVKVKTTTGPPGPQKVAQKVIPSGKSDSLQPSLSEKKEEGDEKKERDTEDSEVVDTDNCEPSKSALKKSVQKKILSMQFKVTTFIDCRGRSSLNLHAIF
jgi:hypothetical protein